MRPAAKGQTARERDTAIFVGGIVGTAMERDIRSYFEQFGEIYSITLIPNKNNRKLNSGYCFISFKESHTKWAVLAIHNHCIYGRRVTCKSLLKGVDLKTEKTKANSKKLCIKFLPIETTETQFQSFFSMFGNIHSFYLVTYRNSHHPTCCGYVIFEEDEVFQRLLDMKYVKFGNNRLQVLQFVKQQHTENVSDSLEPPTLRASIESGPLASMKPTQVSYHKQVTQQKWNYDLNIRFNILQSRMPQLQSNRSGIAAVVQGINSLKNNSIVLKHD